MFDINESEKIYEKVIFLQDSNAQTALSILENEGKEAVLEHLQQWHYPGEHETDTQPSYGSSSQIYKSGNYIVYYNSSLDYIGLDYLKEE